MNKVSVGASMEVRVANDGRVYVTSKGVLGRNTLLANNQFDSPTTYTLAVYGTPESIAARGNATVHELAHGVVVRHRVINGHDIIVLELPDAYVWELESNTNAWEWTTDGGTAHTVFAPYVRAGRATFGA